MAVKYDFFLTPQPKEKQQKVKYHARTVVDKNIYEQGHRYRNFQAMHHQQSGSNGGYG